MEALEAPSDSNDAFQRVSSIHARTFLLLAVTGGIQK